MWLAVPIYIYIYIYDNDIMRISDDVAKIVTTNEEGCAA
jgi:hypothetical protein